SAPKSLQRSQSRESENSDPTIRVMVTGAFARHTDVPEKSSDQRNRAQLARSQRDVAIVDIATGEFRVVSKDIYPTRISLSPDRTTLFYSTFKTQEPNSFFEVSDVHALGIDTFQDRTVFPGVTNYAGGI